jgi:hypothetical protein
VESQPASGTVRIPADQMVDGHALELIGETTGPVRDEPHTLSRSTTADSAKGTAAEDVCDPTAAIADGGVESALVTASFIAVQNPASSGPGRVRPG